MSISQAVPVLAQTQHALAVFELSVSGDAFVATSSLTDKPFDPTHYSEFKYGRRDLAERFGTLMSDALKVHLEAITAPGEPIVVVGTPYKRLPNAARMLAFTVEHHLRFAGLPTSYTTIYQHRLAGGDYGKLSLAERDQRNRQKKRFVDADDFAGRHVVVVDDVRITGSIERSIVAQLAGVPILSLTIINLIRLDETTALTNPGLEDKLNHHAVNDLSDIARLMHGLHDFVLITRVLKYILESDPVEIQNFLKLLSCQEVTDLYEGLIDEGYNDMPQYHEASRIISDAYVAHKH